MSTSPNPYRDPKPWWSVKIGGREVKSYLVAIDGCEIEDDWKVQKNISSSGATAVFQGTKLVEAIKLTFEAPDEESFDDLGDIYEQMAPVPGSGFASSGTTPGASVAHPGGVFVDKTIQSSTASGAAGAEAAAASAASAPSTAKKAATTATPNPGPKPPTLSIENAVLRYIGVTSVCRKKFKAPYVTPTNSWRVDLTLIQSSPSKPAGAGPQSPTSKDSGAGGKAGADPEVVRLQAEAKALEAQAAGV